MRRRERGATRTAPRSSAISRAPACSRAPRTRHLPGNVAALVYVYDHAARDLSKRLVQNFHGHHDLSLATLHVHLDDDSCMEVTALKGSTGEVKHFAERGVRYGRVVMIPTAADKPGKKPRARKHGHSHD
jgi:CopG family transcriptional regulator, nickel-responsive regulator